MARRAGLRARLARLEKRLGRRKPMPTIVTGIYDTSGAEVIGLEGNGVAVMRAGPLESPGALASRCATLTGARVLKTLYAPSLPKSEPVAAPAPVPEAAPVDPWALAGIGRKADRATLERMGAIAVPPERIV